MRYVWLLCVLSGALAWGQAAPVPPPPQAGQAAPAPGAKPQPAGGDVAASVPATAAVITIDGVCTPKPKPAAAKGATVKPTADTKTTSPKSDAPCKTVITKAEFEKLVNSLAPNATPQQKKQLANLLPRYLAMSNEAKKEGLDKTDSYKETVKFVEMQVLSNQLQHKVQEDAGKIGPGDIESYYLTHKDSFEQYNVDRIYIPRTKQSAAAAKDEDDKDKDKDKDEKLTDEQKKAKEDAEKAKSEENEQAMTKLADDLRARAAAGEDIVKLQKEAFEAAGMKIESPTVNLPNIRRTALPPGHAAIFDLKPGEVSQVISDSGGHYIYKMNSVNEMTLDQATNEITGKLKSDRVKEEMDKLNNSFKVEKNEAYFGPDTGPIPPPRGPRPGPGMRPGMQPPGAAVQPQSAPPAQPPAAQPN
jgi:PPIC-type PPIASE domain